MFTTIWRIVSATLRFLWLVLLCPLIIVVATGAAVSIYRAGLSLWKDVPAGFYELLCRLSRSDFFPDSF
ncbi:hypothetical protein BDV32DRAFT_121686 [Aspergillus pseudonomiae]|uniref:Uncharacterized protein n=1 Tax=Aspergillus pseudonomiae TaxID=1506151 RepID=A0A5N6I3Y5_9EURO|nr:uncharacterized protein BDV37DRAFT_259932 [Aspergillus pseudonomiae]KAB8261392.1 hypothetical protein BDV32DRAFT_121686 [Aspergillus pseudonomiae]KAE8399578.1 hypothetical protein BDV37DRAFT_259932 [Aspergillus pseudonomiae]